MFKVKTEVLFEETKKIHTLFEEVAEDGGQSKYETRPDDETMTGHSCLFFVK